MARARERWRRISNGIETLGALHPRSTLERALANLAELVRETRIDDAASGEKSRWMDLRARLLPAYEQLARELRARALRAPSLRPTNWTRIAFHVSSAFGALFLLEVALTESGTRWVTGAFAGTFWFLEITRALSKGWNEQLMKAPFLKHIAHPHERYRVNSATWYATALVLLAWFSPGYASAAALAVLGVGDPIAGLVGRRWGRRELGGGRTLEGTVAFALSGALAAGIILAVAHGGAWSVELVVVALTAGSAGALGEVASRRLDDNFVVPLAAAMACTLAAFIAAARFH